MSGFVLHWLRRLGARQDLVLVSVLVLTVGMMIMPMPAAIADVLIGANLGASVLLMMVAIYLRSPLDLTALPGIILVSTVFRLALEVTVTRLILTEADAGAIVQTFGQFVIAGNVVVGFVVFLIITTVQFIVITKGTERVAEVGARFTLDALPGKQMSIDGDLRSGDIDQREAKRRRHDLERESALHGAMDGAMKFVKGDAVAGLIIIIVNLVGGIGVGVGQHGMPMGDAVETYTLLTVGDALISQIPALLISLTAAIVITRVGGQGLDLGRDMIGQLTGDRQALGLAAIVLTGMALIPGFPKPVFLVLALILAAASAPAPLRRLAARLNPGKEAGGIDPSAPADPSLATTGPRTAASPLAVRLSPALAGALSVDRLEHHLALAASAAETALGVPFPRARIEVTDELAGTSYSIEIDEVPVEGSDLPPDRLLLRDDPTHAELADIPFERSSSPVDAGGEACWIACVHEDRLRAAGIGYHDLAAVVADRVRHTLRRHAARFLGLQEAKRLLHRYEQEWGDLVREATRVVPPQRLADVLRRLVEESVSLRSMRIILEVLAEWGERESRPIILVEHIRQALSRQICHAHANAQKLISAFILSQDSEQMMRDAVRESASGPVLALDAEPADRLVGAIRERLGDHRPGPGQPVIVAAIDVRRFLRGLLARNGLDVAVLSYQDLAPEFPVHPMGQVGLRISASAREVGT